jgi:predicted ArsR family transcriptional regulator
MSEGTSQDKMLYQLKRSGPLTAKFLGDHLNMTTMGARQHLAQLEAEGLVDTTPEETRGRGRPVKKWKLTEQGHGRFPDGHAQVTNDLLIAVTELLGDDALDKLIERRTQTTLQQYQEKLNPLSTIQAKLEALAELRTAEGYMAEIEVSEGEYRLIEHHCPICIAATACQGFCRSELEVFQSLFAKLATVARDKHLINGARRCSYSIVPETSS